MDIGAVGPGGPGCPGGPGRSVRFGRSGRSGWGGRVPKKFLCRVPRMNPPRRPHPRPSPRQRDRVEPAANRREERTRCQAPSPRAHAGPPEKKRCSEAAPRGALRVAPSFAALTFAKGAWRGDWLGRKGLCRGLRKNHVCSCACEGLGWKDGDCNDLRAGRANRRTRRVRRRLRARGKRWLRQECRP